MVAHEANRSAPWLGKYGGGLFVTDLVAVVAAAVVAQWVRFGDDPGKPVLIMFPMITYLEISVLIAVLWMATLSINHSRSPRTIGSGAEEYRRVWLATIAVFGGIAIVSMLFKLEVARGYLMIAMPVGLVLLFLGRWIARKVIVHVRKSYGRCITRLLVVGSPRTVRDLTVALSREPWSGYDVVGACIPGPL
ncbi:MAG TPA: hypothetical protein PLL50_12265, partial [Propionicimonas sp.]|nr:hypothetical protein [Propionicimonas sp.]